MSSTSATVEKSNGTDYFARSRYRRIKLPDARSKRRHHMTMWPGLCKISRQSGCIGLPGYTCYLVEPFTQIKDTLRHRQLYRLLKYRIRYKRLSRTRQIHRGGITMKYWAIAFDTGGTVLDWHASMLDEIKLVRAWQSLAFDRHEFVNTWRRNTMYRSCR